MTDRIIVATFNDTNAAYDAASAIKGLKDAGVADFKLKTGVMLRSDAVDVVYGTMEGYESLGVPYLPHIAPDKRW